MNKPWQSGLIFTAISFLTLGVHWLFQFIVSPQLGGANGEYGLALAVLAFVTFLGMPLQIASQAVTHYIARFHFSGDDERLHGLLAGCRKFLFYITLAGSVTAIVLVKPLGDYFNIPRTSLTLIALVCMVAGFWGSYRDGALPGAGLVQTAGLDRIAGRRSSGFVRRTDHQTLAGGRMGVVASRE